MRAHFLVKNSDPYHAFELRDTALPEPGPGEVRIKVRAFGLNYADIMARQGLYRECPPLPCVIGYDVEGEIAKTGEGVATFRQGDKVFALTRFGGYAEYVIANTQATCRLPDHTPVGTGCALATQCVTAHYAAMHTQTLLPGEKVLVHAAAGGLGTALIQIALNRGCTVIGVAGGQEKAAYLKNLGVQHIIDHRTSSYLTYIQKYLGGKVDVIFDNIGGKSVRAGKSILAHGGRIVLLGAASLSGKRGIISLLRLAIGFGWFSPIAWLGKSQTLIGVNMLKIADHRPDIIEVCLNSVLDLYEQGILRPHIGKQFSFDQLADAHAYMEARKSIGKIVVVV